MQRDDETQEETKLTTGVIDLPVAGAPTRAARARVRTKVDSERQSQRGRGAAQQTHKRRRRRCDSQGARLQQRDEAIPVLLVSRRSDNTRYDDDVTRTTTQEERLRAGQDKDEGVETGRVSRRPETRAEGSAPWRLID